METFCLSGISGSPLVTLNYSYISLRKLSRHRPRFITTSAFPRASFVSLSLGTEEKFIARLISIDILPAIHSRLIFFPVTRNDIVVIFKCFVIRKNKYVRYTKKAAARLWQARLPRPSWPPG